MKDVVVVTADSVRLDFINAMEFASSLDIRPGIAGGHYTRPSLASLLSASYRGAVESRAVSPTVAEAFTDAGYSCIGVSGSPHTDSQFGFGAGFEETYENLQKAGNRGNSARQFFSQFDLIRRIYHRFKPPEAKLDKRPSNAELIDEAVSAFNHTSPPRFMWVHLMGTHRPYGTGDQAVPEDIDRKALFTPEGLTDAEQATIESRYCDALARADDEIRRLLEEVDSDPLFVFSSDHGDEFGEEGHYFHQPQRRRVADALVTVPVASRGFDFEADRMSLLDVGPTLAGAAGVDFPDAWHGIDQTTASRRSALTVAPWHNQATVSWRDFGTGTAVVSRDADVSMTGIEGQASVERSEIPDELEEQLRDLGYKA
jgi:arylsulfatase A-like enzyme